MRIIFVSIDASHLHRCTGYHSTQSICLMHWSRGRRSLQGAYPLIPVFVEPRYSSAQPALSERLLFVTPSPLISPTTRACRYISLACARYSTLVPIDTHFAGSSNSHCHSNRCDRVIHLCESIFVAVELEAALRRVLQRLSSVFSDLRMSL